MSAPGAILGVVAAAFAILVTHLLRSAHLPRLVILAGAVITSAVAWRSSRPVAASRLAQQRLLRRG